LPLPAASRLHPFFNEGLVVNQNGKTALRIGIKLPGTIEMTLTLSICCERKSLAGRFSRPREDPVLIIFEDVYWLDPTSLEAGTASTSPGRQ
jgi:hypothetical protein